MRAKQTASIVRSRWDLRMTGGHFYPSPEKHAGVPSAGPELQTSLTIFENAKKQKEEKFKKKTTKYKELSIH